MLKDGHKNKVNYLNENLRTQFRTNVEMMGETIIYITQNSSKNWPAPMFKR